MWWIATFVTLFYFCICFGGCRTGRHPFELYYPTRTFTLYALELVLTWIGMSWPLSFYVLFILMAALSFALRARRLKASSVAPDIGFLVINFSRAS